jgi:hypothetical protein
MLLSPEDEQPKPTRWDVQAMGLPFILMQEYRDTSSTASAPTRRRRYSMARWQPWRGTLPAQNKDIYVLQEDGEPTIRPIFCGAASSGAAKSADTTGSHRGLAGSPGVTLQWGSSSAAAQQPVEVRLVEGCYCTYATTV